MTRERRVNFDSNRRDYILAVYSLVFGIILSRFGKCKLTYALPGYKQVMTIKKMIILHIEYLLIEQNLVRELRVWFIELEKI